MLRDSLREQVFVEALGREDDPSLDPSQLLGH